MCLNAAIAIRFSPSWLMGIHRKERRFDTTPVLFTPPVRRVHCVSVWCETVRVLQLLVSDHLCAG